MLRTGLIAALAMASPSATRAQSCLPNGVNGPTPTSDGSVTIPSAATISAATNDLISFFGGEPPVNTPPPSTAAPVNTPPPSTAAPVNTPPPSTAAPVNTPPPSTAAPTNAPPRPPNGMGGGMGGGRGRGGGRNRPRRQRGGMQPGGMGPGGGQPPANGMGNGGVNGLTDGDAAGAALRLAFHDAAGSNGANGCVDLTNADNGGLGPIIDQLEALRAPYCTQISRADFWALAAFVAVEELAPQPVLNPIRFGRVDNQTCSDFSGGQSLLPGAEGGAEEIERVFVNQMGLTMNDAAALMGAHTLGRAQRGNSGYNGPWDVTPSVFDNEYYQTLVNDPWNRNQNVGANQVTEWRRGPTLMLNTDMVLAYDVVTDAGANVPGANNCPPVRVGNRRGCQLSDDFNNLALVYAQNQDRWFNDFAVSFDRMMTIGAGVLSEVN